MCKAKTYLAACFAFMFFVSAFSLPPSAQAAVADISADTTQKVGDAYFLSGNVTINYDGNRINADNMIYNTATNEVTSEGPVTLVSPEVNIKGNNAFLDINSGVGVVYDAEFTIREQGFHVKAEEVHMLGPEEFYITRGSVTTCEGPVPDWCIAGSDIHIRLGHRLKAWNTTLRARDKFPVIYVPYIWIPLVEDRTTGLLPPVLGYKRSTGFSYEQSFFWAMAENRDSTYTLDYRSENVFGQSVEYRYIEEEGVFGQARGNHIRDDDRGLDYYEGYLRHMHKTPGFDGIVDLNVTDRKDYYHNYATYLNDSSRRYNESKVEASVPMGNSRAYVLGRFYQDMKEGVEADSLLKREPEAGLYIAPRGVGPVALSGSLKAVDFRRDEGTEGQRQELSLRASQYIGAGLSQSVELNRYMYLLSGEDSTGDPVSSAERWLGVYIYSAEAGITAERGYGSSGTFVHSIEPSLGYKSVGLSGADSMPVFFDETEFATERSEVALSLMNRFYIEDKEVGTLRLRQPYDLMVEDGTFGIFEADASVKTLPAQKGAFWASVILAARYDHEESEFSSLAGKFRLSRDKSYIAVGESYVPLSDIRVYTLEASHQGEGPLTFTGIMRYDDSEEGGFEDIELEAVYWRKCWGIKMTYVEKPDDHTLLFELVLLGIGGVGLN